MPVEETKLERGTCAGGASDAVAAAIAASKSSDMNENDDKKTPTETQVAVAKEPVVNGKDAAVAADPIDDNKDKEKKNGDGDGQEEGQEEGQDTATVPAPPTKIDGGDTVTYITPQKLVYIYNKDTRKIYEYEESLENKEDNLREVKLKDGSESTFQIKIGDVFETITDTNVKDHYKFITKNVEITDYFFRDMLYASTAVLIDIKNLFSGK